MRTQAGHKMGKGGRGACAKELRWPLEAGKGKETNSPLEPPGKNAAQGHLDLDR